MFVCKQKLIKININKYFRCIHLLIKNIPQLNFSSNCIMYNITYQRLSLLQLQQKYEQKENKNKS